MQGVKNDSMGPEVLHTLIGSFHLEISAAPNRTNNIYLDFSLQCPLQSLTHLFTRLMLACMLCMLWLW